MGRLIIAEKHSVAQAIAAALGGGKAEDGWIGCGADAVTWAQGHLVDLLTPDEYQDRGWDKWSMDALPLDPTGGWKWKVNRQRGADRQYRVVAGLLKSDAYDVLVNACDPDREGESIFHRIVSYAGTRKPMLRLWVASLEEDAIRDALDSMRSEDEYRGLAEAADIRAKADWLIGMNASRAYTLVYHRRMSVGRVQTPTLAMVADRDRQIAHHVEKPFWKVVVPMGGWTLTGERLDDRTDAEALKSIVDAPDFTFQVFSVQRRTVLDGLSGDERLTLVRVVRRMWEATADDYVHDTVQVIANLNPHWCESHPDEGCRLSEGECRFTSRSDQPVSLGWKAIEPAKADRGDDADEEEASSARNVIPVNLSTGVSLRPVSESSVSEGRTKPPKPFTEATLLAAMEHASRYVEDKDLKAALDDDESHSGGIGTPATRADVIEKLVHAGYMERKGKQLHSTEAGRTLVDVVSPRLRDVSLTADMERSLGDVERGGAHADAVYEEFRGYARAIPADAAANVKAERVGQSGGKTESYGRCPRCGGNVVKRGKTWTCSTNRNEKQADGTWKRTDGCGYRVFPTIAGKTLTDAQVRKVLGGQAVLVKGFTSKSGKKFDARLVADKERGVAFDFGK